MRGLLSTAPVILFTALTILLAGCAPTNVGHVNGVPPDQMTEAQKIDMAVSQTINNQQRLNLTQDQLQGFASCVPFKNGMPEPPHIKVPTNQLSVVETRDGSLFCNAQNLDGQVIPFLARRTEATTPASASETSGSGMGGIGVEYQVTEAAGVKVVGIVPGTAAAEEGSIQPGDRILGVAPDDTSEMENLDGRSLNEVMALIRGDVDTTVALTVLKKGALDSTRVTLTRGRVTNEQLQAYQAQKLKERKEKITEKLVIKGNDGEYMSPYTSDGVVAEWVDKAINAEMGSATGSALGSAAGAYAGQKALESVPGGGLLGSAIGGMLGSDAGGSAGRDAAIEASGGWEYIRSTSDLSFRSLDHMAKWLVLEHGDNQTFPNVVSATQAIYPGLEKKLAQYGR